MQTEDQGAPQASPDEDDELLRERIGTCIAEACGGDMPDGVAVHVVNRRVTITGRVEDVDLAQRIEKAAATPPGILGVSNQLTTRVPPPVEPPGQPPASGMQADPAKRPPGQVNHKV
ncbi:BON domain-containing protein [Cupriavidus sp. YR651]|uniref:BON domain-containing protein n=1 Tax=Cupriavidus sp. YR651 TaxID=1855315 RepID=UPI00088A0593|nr:BON domain-containing protein [Cupriavidus sp. YR651]SDC73584.1 BON domain-containing protein [Cupriavidus sp. YR651]